MAAGRSRGSRPRRVILPGVAELLRPAAPGLVASSGRQATGREAHTQKSGMDTSLIVQRLREATSDPEPAAGEQGAAPAGPQ